MGKALYEALPQFLCGNENRKEDKIVLCYKGTDICIARDAALVQIKKGAYLGACEEESAVETRNVISISDELQTEDAGFSAFPNPFSHHLTINFKVAVNGLVNVQLFDLNGKMVKQLFDGVLTKGMVKQLRLSSENLAVGTYICRLKTGTGISQRKIILNR